VSSATLCGLRSAIRRALLLSAIPPLAACGEGPSRDASPAPPTEARSPFATADSLRDEGRAQEALARYRALRDSFMVTGDTAGLWRAWLWEADMLRRLGRRDSARVGLTRAMALAAGRPNREGWVRVVRSQLLEREGKLDLALVDAERALATARAIGEVRLEAAAQNARGTALSLRGRYREALAADSAALALRRRVDGSPRALAEGLNEVGIGYRHLGRYTDAVRAYEEALGIFREMGNPVGSAMVLYNLANIRSATGEVGQAIQLLTESLRLTEQIQHPQGMGLNHNNLASVYLRAGNRRAARPHLERGLEIHRESGFVYGEVLALEHLGRLELAGARTIPAREALTTALVLADSAGFARERVSVRATLAHTSAAEGHAREALRWANAAVLIADSLGDPEAQFEAMEARAAALEAAGSGAAAGAYLRAIDFLESWRGRLALGDLRMGVAEPRYGAYEGAVRVLLQQDRAAEAFAVAERARARLLLELMAERDMREAERSRAGELRQQLRERFAARAEKDARSAIDREIEQLTRELSALEAQARQRDPATGVVHYPYPASLAEVQTGLLRSGRALLAYFWGDRDVYGWWITGGEMRARRLGASDSLAVLVDFLRGALEQPSGGPAWSAPAHRAYGALVAPLSPAPAEEILVLPSGPLSHLPFEVLIPQPRGVPWGATHRFVYGPSASVLLALARDPVPPSRWERTVLAVGDPAVREGGAAGPEGERTDPLAPLPHAAAEARAVHQLFRAEGADLLLGRRATLERWLDLDPARYRYLHFAAHAWVSDRRPERTHLVLADGQLDLAAIRRLRLRSELVTLSACETALGRRVRGEGIIGLPHAFLGAGARGVVVTLWRVADQSTADFMRDFYAELHAGHPPAEALRRARRSRILSGNPAHPSSWAPFVLVGSVTR
jgi:CHAT domain-containing protein/tetratricopeptide (TPR) repeat protein